MHPNAKLIPFIFSAPHSIVRHILEGIEATALAIPVTAHGEVGRDRVLYFDVLKYDENAIVACYLSGPPYSKNWPNSMRKMPPRCMTLMGIFGPFAAHVSVL